jgi:hypothetical protein
MADILVSYFYWVTITLGDELRLNIYMCIYTMYLL